MIRDALQASMPKGINISLVSRDRFASPAEGSAGFFKQRQEQIIKKALKIGATKTKNKTTTKGKK